MLAAQPEVARPAYRSFRERRRGVGCLLVVEREQAVDFAWVEAGEVEIVIRRLDVLEFESEQFFIEVRPGRRPVHKEPERLHLLRRPLIAKDHRNFFELKFPRGL